MAFNRHLSRTIALQTLFEASFRKIEFQEIIQRIIPLYTENVDFEFVTKLLEETFQNELHIDQIITKIAPEWNIAQIANLDLAIFRLALAEILYFSRESSPIGIVISEAVELAKTFSSVTSSQFINAALRNFSQEISS